MLENKFKIPGILLVLAGIILAGLYFLIDLRFELPILALVSSYMETRFFAVFKTNFADETILLLLLTGFSLRAFSKEKHESQSIRQIRNQALKRTIICNTGILLFSVLFFYGTDFSAILFINTVLPFILYLSFFNFLKNKKINT